MKNQSPKKPKITQLLSGDKQQEKSLSHTQSNRRSLQRGKNNFPKDRREQQGKDLSFGDYSQLREGGRLGESSEKEKGPASQTRISWMEKVSRPFKPHVTFHSQWFALWLKICGQFLGLFSHEVAGIVSQKCWQVWSMLNYFIYFPIYIFVFL